MSTAILYTSKERNSILRPKQPNGIKISLPKYTVETVIS